MSNAGCVVLLWIRGFYIYEVDEKYSDMLVDDIVGNIRLFTTYLLERDKRVSMTVSIPIYFSAEVRGSVLRVYKERCYASFGSFCVSYETIDKVSAAILSRTNLNRIDDPSLDPASLRDGCPRRCALASVSFIGISARLSPEHTYGSYRRRTPGDRMFGRRRFLIG